MKPPCLLAHFSPRSELVDLRSGVTLAADALWARVETRARALGPACPAGGCAVVAQPDPLDYLVDIFALWSAGCVAVAVNPSITQEERANVMAATGAAVLLDGGPLPASTAPVADTEPLGPDAPALVLMTSGTTGRPKGIVHSQRSLAARVALNCAAIGSEDLGRSLCVLPLHFGHGLIGNVFTPLAAGGTLLLWPRPSIDEMKGFSALVEAQRVSFMSSTPSFWSVAMRLSPRPAHAMRRVHVGSAPLSLDAWRVIAEWTGAARVLNMYGMTETANWIAGAALDEVGAGEGTGDGAVGRPWGGRLAVLDGEGRVAHEGTGEVLVASPSIMSAYLGMEKETKAAFHGAWLRTGDTGRIDTQGRLTLVGRIKHEINRGGVKIPAEEIDMLLERHADVEEACAFALPDPVAGESVAAAVVLREGGDPDAIKAWCRERCRAEAVPTRLFAMQAIPRNDRGKIVRDEVRKAALALAGGKP